MSGTAGVNDLCAGRIYPWGGGPEDPATPYVLYSQVSDGASDARGMVGPASYFRTLQQIDVFASDRATADRLANAIRAALDGVDSETTWGGMTIRAAHFDSQLDGSFEDQPNLYRVIQQFRIVWKEN